MPTRKDSQKFIRNIRHVQVAIRLDTGRRIELRPRGERGDTVPVNTEEMQDEKFIGNQNLLFELLTGAEGKKVIEKQTANQQSVHPALSQLRNERGEEYTRGVVVEENFQDQGKAVAVVDERGQIQRFKAPGTVDYVPQVPADVPENERADWLARQKNVEGPEAGLGDLKVTKGEVERN